MKGLGEGYHGHQQKQWVRAESRGQSHAAYHSAKGLRVARFQLKTKATAPTVPLSHFCGVVGVEVVEPAPGDMEGRFQSARHGVEGALVPVSQRQSL